MYVLIACLLLPQETVFSSSHWHDDRRVCAGWLAGWRFLCGTRDLRAWVRGVGVRSEMGVETAFPIAEGLSMGALTFLCADILSLIDSSPSFLFHWRDD